MVRLGHLSPTVHYDWDVLDVGLVRTVSVATFFFI
jgi:hypothetical protein